MKKLNLSGEDVLLIIAGILLAASALFIVTGIYFNFFAFGIGMFGMLLSFVMIALVG